MAKLDLNTVKMEIVKHGVDFNFSTIFTVYYHQDIAGHEYAVIEVYDKFHFKGFITVMPEYYDHSEQIALEIIKLLKDEED